MLLVGTTTKAVDGHLQLLHWVLIWPEEPQLIDLVGFAEMGRRDSVPFFDLTSKHSDVGHHSSVVVKAGVKHQGLKGVIRACYRPDNTKTRGGWSRWESLGPYLCVSNLSVFQKKKKPMKMKVLTGGFCQQLLGEPFQHLFQVWLISERRSGFNMETKRSGGREYELCPRTTTHSNALLTWNIKHLFDL